MENNTNSSVVKIPSDIFISYKSQDDASNKTSGYYLAEELYSSLKKRGYYPFFSRVALDDKHGREFKPIIDEALETAHVMILIISSLGDLESEWVKEEYNTFFAKKKLVIPVYRNLSDEDRKLVPMEIRNIQSFDVTDRENPAAINQVAYNKLLECIDSSMSEFKSNFLRMTGYYISAAVKAFAKTDGTTTSTEVKIYNAIDKLSKVPFKKKMAVAGGVLGGIVALIILISTLSWYNSIEQQIIRALEKENYDYAIELYQENTDKSKIDDIEHALIRRLQTIEKDYMDLKMDYSVAHKEINTIRKMDIYNVNEKLEEVLSKINVINESRTAFSAAESFMKGEDYANAIIQYSNVSEKDTANYEVAKKRLEDAIVKYREKVANEAAAFAKQEDYVGALTALETALNILPNDPKISELKLKYSAENAKKIKKDALAKAKEYAEEKDFKNSILTIKAAQTGENEFDAELQAALTMYEKKFVEAAIAQADALIAKRDYNGALNALSEAKEFLPDNDELETKYTEVDENKPVSVSTLNFINGTWNDIIDGCWNGGTPKDPFGNIYSNVSNFLIFSTGYYRESWYHEYRLYGKYKTLTGACVPYEDIETDGSCTLHIYADEKPVYTITVKRKTDIKNFSADIEGAEYIKIVMEGDANHKYNSMILMDLLLWKD